MANKSQSTVYYVTFPVDSGSKVPTKTKTYAFKVISNQHEFIREVDFLKKIKETWENDNKFYYVNDSYNLALKSSELNITRKCTESLYSWISNGYFN